MCKTAETRNRELPSSRNLSGGASAVKEPGHFKVKILQPGHPDALFSSKKVYLFSFFSCRPQNAGRQRRFTVRIRHIKRSYLVTFLLSVHNITEAKQYTRLGRTEPGLEPGHLTWRVLVWHRHFGNSPSLAFVHKVDSGTCSCASYSCER